MECIYTIRVECSVEDICSSDEVEMTFNTVIVPMKNEDYGKYVPPANWNPQTFPVFTVATPKAKWADCNNKDMRTKTKELKFVISYV